MGGGADASQQIPTSWHRAVKFCRRAYWDGDLECGLPTLKLAESDLPHSFILQGCHESNRSENREVVRLSNLVASLQAALVPTKHSEAF